MSRLRRIIKFISQRLFPHLFIIFSIMLITFQILNGFNPTMGFMDYWMTEVMIYVFCGAALVNGILTIIIDRIEYKEKNSQQDSDKGE